MQEHSKCQQIIESQRKEIAELKR